MPIYVLKGSGERYIPPREGTLFLSVVDAFARKPIFRVISSCDRDYINEVAEQTGETIQMTSFGVKSYKIRLDEALNLAGTMLRETRNTVGVVAKLLPQTSNSEDARALVKKVNKIFRF